MEEPDPLLAGSAPELVSGLEAGLNLAMLLSNSIIPGNGNSLESLYFARLLAGYAGNGEVPPFLEGSGKGLGAELGIPLVFLLLSNSIIPGNGNSLESIYFARSLAEYAGNGEVSNFVEGCSKGDGEIGDEFNVCSAGWLCWNANIPSLSGLSLVNLAPLSQLMLRSNENWKKSGLV